MGCFAEIKEHALPALFSMSTWNLEIMHAHCLQSLIVYSNENN